MSAAELKYPSTAFGELRRLAIVEHGKKKRAARFLSLWYGRQLVKRGFIKDAQRRRELFSPLSSTPFAAASTPFSFDDKNGVVERVKSVFHMPSLSPLRRRRNRKWEASDNSQQSEDQESLDNPWPCRDIEIGVVDDSNEQYKEHEETHKSSKSWSVDAQEIDLPLKEDRAQKQQALHVIAQLDPLTKTA